MSDYAKTSQFSIPAGTRVLAIECEDIGAGGQGILASASMGMKTGPSWQCASQLVENWTQPDFVFPPNVFSSPKILGNNGVSPWGVRLPNIKLICTQNRIVKTIPFSIQQVLTRFISCTAKFLTGLTYWKMPSGSGQLDHPPGLPAGLNLVCLISSAAQLQFSDFGPNAKTAVSPFPL